MLGVRVLAVNWTLLGANAIGIVLRLLVRIRMKRMALTLGDYLLVTALGSQVTAQVLDTVTVAGGNVLLKAEQMTDLQHPSDVIVLLAELGKLEHALKVDYVGTVLLIITLWLIKYFHLFQNAKIRLKIALWFTTAWSASGFIMSFFLWLFWCKPLSTVWSLFNNCQPMTEWFPFFTFTGMDLSSDFLIILLPVFIINSTQLHENEKRALLFIFLIGLVSIAANMVRIGLVIKFNRIETPSPDYAELMDICMIVEVTTAFLAACLPALRVLVFGGDAGEAFWKNRQQRRKGRFEAWQERFTGGGGRRRRSTVGAGRGGGARRGWGSEMLDSGGSTWTRDLETRAQA